MKNEQIKKTYTTFFAIVTVSTLFAVSLITASQHVSAAVHHKVAVHHKAHTASTRVYTTVAVHHKATASKGKISVHQVAVIPETHGIPLLNATAFKKEIAREVKGPYGEKDVIGGMMADGY